MQVCVVKGQRVSYLLAVGRWLVRNDNFVSIRLHSDQMLPCMFRGSPSPLGHPSLALSFLCSIMYAYSFLSKFMYARGWPMWEAFGFLRERDNLPFQHHNIRSKMKIFLQIVKRIAWTVHINVFLKEMLRWFCWSIR